MTLMPRPLIPKPTCLTADLMRILWLSENYPPRRGGMAQACDRIVGNLRQAGLQIDIVFFTNAGHSFKSVQQTNGRLLVVPAGDSPGHTLNCLYNYLSDPMHRVEYSHIVAFGGYLPVMALPVFKAWLNSRAITMLRGNDFDLGVFSAQRRALLADAVNISEATCVLSSEAQQKVALLFPKAKLKLVANGVDSDSWRCESCDYEAAENWKKQNPAENRLTIGIIGQLKEKKGVIFFLENVLQAGLHESFRFLLIGDVEPQVQEWLNAKTDRLSIVQLPFLDRFELLRWYPVCDYVALPSHYDGMPNVLLEAGALAIPVIAARVGGISEVLPETLQQLTFHPGNAEDCREALWQAARLNSEERHEIGESFAGHVARHFSSQRETKGYLKIFNAL
ncbi:MAG: glycogen synthase [Candidatus Riflebacteria bacterium HGW-Riflebacteria-1]|nr:MAG: glycogen synthase [Candidatus Riflebacteria bacterium HGW-Riflebacteria-1]